MAFLESRDPMQWIVMQSPSALRCSHASAYQFFIDAGKLLHAVVNVEAACEHTLTVLGVDRPFGASGELIADSVGPHARPFIDGQEADQPLIDHPFTSDRVRHEARDAGCLRFDKHKTQSLVNRREYLQ